MTDWQTSNRKGLYVRRAARCGARHGRRCSCEPSDRVKRRSPVTGQPEYSRASKQRSEILTWLEGRPQGHRGGTRAPRGGPNVRRTRQPLACGRLTTFVTQERFVTVERNRRRAAEIWLWDVDLVR